MRRYSQEFKQQALQLSDEIGTKEAVKNLGISYGTLTDWRKNEKSL
ncbi:transposase [Treponema phagedenis]|nr:transposase [Treponema phagedenis]NVP25754.1 transposase [Treponema phagedenis]QLC60232.1 transposase [Treponema phagedenis]